MSVYRAGRARVAGVALCCVLGSSLAGCSREALPVLPNLRPTIEVTQAPVSANQPFYYGYELRWAGYDADGYIDHFRYVVDPPTTPNAETTWVRTEANRQSFLFKADDLSNGSDRTAQGYHTIVLQAIDDRGGMSVPVWRSLTSFTVAPTVQIIQPPPNPLWPPTYGPGLYLKWVGTDPDGRNTSKPVKYKFKLFNLDSPEFPFEKLLTEPDSLRRRYAPNFAGWDSCGGDTTEATFRNLTATPGFAQKYMAVVVGFDEAGAYSPVMSQGANMLFFNVTVDGGIGPQLTILGEGVHYKFEKAVLPDAEFLRVEVAAGRPVRFNWFGETTGGSYVAGYRWMVDGNVSDERPRQDENSTSEFNRWSRWSPLTLGVDLPAYMPAGETEQHTLYLEAIDNNGILSRAGVRFTVVRAVFDKDLLVVDDTRLPGDRNGTSGCVILPRPSVWPSASELDTFFFARGGVPWRCTPAGTMSPPGIFSGYDYDTLGTRFLPQGRLTLQRISRYRHIIWYTDAKGARNTNDPDYAGDPMSQLRFFTGEGRTNPLATWIGQGGQLWMSGGGCATALQVNGDQAPFDIFSSETGELGPGRFMHDLMGWRSEIMARTLIQAEAPHHPRGRETSPIDYTGLPEELIEKRIDTDPATVYAPGRTNISDFYQSSHSGEGLSKSNNVIEDRDPSPGIRREASVLDTVYESRGGQLGSGKPVMTVYHGGFTGQVQVFSGFQLWYWNRDTQIQILDWVLQRVWKLPRRNVPR